MTEDVLISHLKIDESQIESDLKKIGCGCRRLPCQAVFLRKKDGQNWNASVWIQT